MFLHVSTARYLGDYRIEIGFDDGKTGVADLSSVLRGAAFQALEDQEIFSRLRVDDELETIVWPNGADLAPEFLYFQVFKDAPELQDRFKRWGYLD